MMQIVTERQTIRDGVKTFERQYNQYENDYRFAQGDTLGEARARIARLDISSCSVADVDEAIGVDGWASNDCGQCGQSVAVLICFSDHDDEQSVKVCGDCLKSALAEIEDRLSREVRE